MTAIEPTDAKEIVHDKWLRWKAGELSAEGALDALFDEVVCPPLSGSSAPQEPDARDRSSYDNVDVGRYRGIDDSGAQEPVADDDAEWLRLRILAALGGLRDDMPAGDVAAVQRFVDRLQGKAPETGEE